MATKVLMPQLGESVTEGTISKWLVKVGDRVNKYDPLCEVITDKVTAEVPSTVSGTVVEIVAQEDETIAVGKVICIIQEEGEEGIIGNGEKALADIPAASNPQAEQGQSMRKRYSPAVLRLAEQYAIDLEQIEGTGIGGRITRKDVEAYIERMKKGEIKREIPPAAAEANEAVQTALEATGGVNQAVPEKRAAYPEAGSGDIVIPVSPVRRTIANRMVTSKHEAPHAWMMIEIDATNLVQFRNQIKEEFRKKEGINLTYLPFFIKAVVEALKEFPIINSQWAGDKIIQKKEINISIAVAAEDALYVPVIKNADEKSILGLARAIDDLVSRARQGRLTQEDISGGTFTVNNTGSFGSIQSMPIINYPQAAILSIEAIVKRPVIRENMIAIRDMVNVCMSLDHRILDGLVCGRFLQSVKQKIEAIGPDTQLY